MSEAARGVGGGPGGGAPPPLPCPSTFARGTPSTVEGWADTVTSDAVTAAVTTAAPMCRSFTRPPAKSSYVSDSLPTAHCGGPSGRLASRDVDLAALVHDVDELLVVRLADDERIRIALLARLQLVDVRLQRQHQRVVLQRNLDAGLLRLVPEVIDRLQVRREPFVRDRARRQDGSAVQRGHPRAAVVFDREDVAHRSGRVTGDRDRRHLEVAEDDRRSFGYDLGVLRQPLRRRRRCAVRPVP